MSLKAALPVLHVERSRAAETFYCGALGFRLEFAFRPDPKAEDPCYFGVSRDGVWLHLSSFSGDAVPGGVAFILTDDVDGLHREFSGKGVPIALPPTDQTWGNREMYVKDPFGNSLRFTRESA